MITLHQNIAMITMNVKDLNFAPFCLHTGEISDQLVRGFLVPDLCPLGLLSGTCNSSIQHQRSAAFTTVFLSPRTLYSTSVRFSRSRNAFLLDLTYHSSKTHSQIKKKKYGPQNFSCSKQLPRMYLTAWQIQGARFFLQIVLH